MYQGVEAFKSTKRCEKEVTASKPVSFNNSSEKCLSSSSQPKGK